MGSCYSGNHIAKDHIHTDITTCNTEEPQHKYRLGTISNRLLRCGGGLKLHVILLDPNSGPLTRQWFETIGPHKGNHHFE